LTGTLTRTTGENAGSYSILQNTLTSVNNPNYSITYVGDNFTINIKSLTISNTTIAPRAYDGTKNVGAITIGNIIGLVAGENLIVTPSGTNYATANVGSHTSTITYTLTDGTNGLANNYSVTGDNIIGNITKAPLTISGTTIASKIYDSKKTVGTLTIGSINGLVTGEDLLITPVGTDYATGNAGSHTSTITYTLADGTNGLANNYSVNGDNIIGVIIKAPLTISSTTIAPRVYDGSKTVGAITIGSVNGLITGEDLTITTSGTNYTSANVGSYTSTITYLLADGTNGLANNYTITLGSATGSITKAPLTITGTTIASRVYDGSKTTGQITPGSLSGLVGAETVLVSAIGADYSSKNVGTYSSSISYTLSNGTNGGLAANYSLANESLNGTITPMPLIITATISDKVYDATASVSGINFASNKVAGDIILVAKTAANYTDANAGVNKVVNINGLSIAGADAGNYTISNSNLTKTGNILPKLISVVADPQLKLLGDVDPVLTYHSTGLIAPDMLTGNLERDLGESIGLYNIKVGTVSTTANYSINFTSAIFEIKSPATSLAIPNAFTPNNDGHNDKFMLFNNGFVLTTGFTFKVFNRAGQLLFSTTYMNEGWDGRYNGVLQETGAYIWAIDFVNVNNKQEHQSGQVLLLN
jgi:gliding motility-associated-like protein